MRWRIKLRREVLFVLATQAHATISGMIKKRTTLLATLLGLPLICFGQGFRELEVVTVMDPTSQFMKIALTGQEFCNLSRDLKGLARHAPPSVPQPYVSERTWTVSNGKDFVLRQRPYALQPVDIGDELNCHWENNWTERIMIQRGGRTTEISRSNAGEAEIQRDAYTMPWRLDKLDAYPIRKQVLDLALRCATPEALARANILMPMIGMTEICLTQQPAVFRDFDGKSLVVQSTADASLFGGKGGEFKAVQRVRVSRAASVTDRTWNPATYLTD